MTYNVFGGTLSLNQSINQSILPAVTTFCSVIVVDCCDCYVGVML